MLYDTRRFVFTVSLCAMLAVNPVLATAPGEEELVSTVHDVYTESTNTGTEGAPLNLSSGIAGVTYVNRMVNSAGNAAQRAEDHAAAAGASAIAAQSAADDAQSAADDAQSAADAATETLKSKLDISQGTDNKDKVMVVGSDGNLTPGMVGTAGIANGAITTDKIGRYAVQGINIAHNSISSDNIYDYTISPKDLMTYTGSAMGSSYFTPGGILLVGSANGGGYSDTDMFSTGLVTFDLIATGAVTFGHLNAYTGNAFSSGYGVLMASSAGNMYWNQVTSNVIETSAVTSDKIASGAVMFGNIAADGYNGNYKHGTVLMYSGDSTSSGMYWGKVNSDMIDNGAVTPTKTEGVVGAIPWGSADSTTYGQFWIE